MKTVNQLKETFILTLRFIIHDTLKSGILYWQLSRCQWYYSVPTVGDNSTASISCLDREWGKGQ